MIDAEELAACPVCGAPGRSCVPVYDTGLIITKEEETAMPGMVLNQRTYLDADGKATADPEKGVSLLGIQGDEIPDADAERYGLQVAEAGEDLPYRDLQARAKELGIPASGSKEELQAAIKQAEAESADGSPTVEVSAPPDNAESVVTNS